MATKQRILFDGTFEKSATVDGTYTRIAEVKAFTLPRIVVDYQEATSLDSPNRYREFVAGLRDVEDITVNCGYVSETMANALTDQASGVPIFYKVTLPLEVGQTVGDVFVFSGYPTPMPQANGVGEIIGLDIQIKVTGGFTFTKGT